MDTGPEAIGDAVEHAQIGRQARGVYVKALVTAAALTAVALVIP